MIIGIGVDVVEIERVRAMLDRHGEDAMYRRLLTEDESAYCRRKAQPAQHMAARLAAKEAAFKALAGSDDARAIGWREIEVRTDQWGRPSLAFHGRAEDRAEELGVTRVHVSLTHGAGAAVAMVVLEGPP